MRKTKKQLLGLVCLAAVALMTAFAISLPAPDAAAADEEPAQADGDVEINVTILSAKSSVHIEEPSNGSTTTKNKVPVKISYSEAVKISLFYSYTGIDGKPYSGKTEYTPTNSEYGIYSTELDLATYANNDGVTLKAIVQGPNGTMIEDTVKFGYRAVSTEIGTTDPETGNPSVDIDVDETVEELQVCVYDKNGKPVFASKEDPENGCASIKLGDIDPATGEIEVTMPDGSVLKGKYDPETGEISIDIPMDESGAGEGDYTVVIVGTDKDGNIVSMNQNTFTYQPTTPNLPNTGSIFGDLNISRADYLVTGLIAFGLAAGFAMVLIFRRNHRN